MSGQESGPQQTNESTRYWLALHFTSGVGPKLFRRLLDRFGDPQAACDASLADLMDVHRVGETLATRIKMVDAEKTWEELVAILKEGITVLTLADEAYPEPLRLIPDAPPVLFVRGTVLPDDTRALAVVGSRACSEGGAAVAHRLAVRLAEEGYTVVSGLAEGIDTAAHQGALDARGRTLAVLGCGIRIVHPADNLELARRIVHRGALLSELHPNARPRGGTLMARDRIVSGLSQGTIVVEAQSDGGSLDTAEGARKQGGPVFAVDLDAAGNQRLLAAGALRLDHQDLDVAAIAEHLEEPEGVSSDHPPAQLSFFT